MPYWEREIRRLVGKAIHAYGMVQDGDRILVGVSGGKDSLSLLHLLHERRKRVPIRYDLVAVHIDLGFGEGNVEALKAFFEEKGIPHRFEHTEIGELAHSTRNRENPCFLCAWERRKRTFQLAHELRCNKIAFGHHKDDVVETLLLNIFYSAEISTMLPVQPLFKGKMSLIRPLFLVEERKIARFAEAMKFPVGSSGCPSCGRTKRHEIKEVIALLEKRNHRVKGNIFRSLSNVKLEYTLMGFGNGGDPFDRAKPRL
jgi:tRNA 2-thiocytidine biosynthesis protein TtcA